MLLENLFQSVNLFQIIGILGNHVSITQISPLLM